MMKRTGLCIVILLACSYLCMCQGVKISGLVTDDQDTPLIGATIVVNNSGVTSDENGNFTFDLIPGNYDVECSYLGFEKSIKNIEVVSGGTYAIYFALLPSNVLLETATVTSTKHEIRLAESTVTIEVVKPQLIENTNTNAIDEVLDRIPGVQIIEDQPNIRGGSGWSYGAGSRVMVLLDDMPALQADAGLPQWDDIPTENISQIEVVKGASSALYGSAALNGIINFRSAYATSDPVTRISFFHNRFDDPKDIRKQWREGGTPRNSGMSIMHKQKAGKFDLVFGGYYFNQDSLHSYADQKFRRKTRLNANVRYRATDRLSFGLNTIVNDGKSSNFLLWRDAISGSYRPYSGTVTRGENLRFTVDPNVTYYDRNNNRHKVQGRYYYVNNKNNMSQSNASQLIFTEYQFQRRFDDSNVTLTSGVSGSWFSSDSDLFSDTLIQSRNFATYVQLDKKVYDRLNISLGGRYEYNKQITPDVVSGVRIPAGVLDEGKFIARLGLNYELSSYTFVRSSFGQGYRYPTITERFVSTNFSDFTIFPNPTLESETGWSGEIGIKQGFKLLDIEGFLDIATFWSEYSNMMEFSFVSVNEEMGFQSRNVGDTQIKGFEIGVVGQSKFLKVPIRFFGGYTYVDPTYKNFTEEIRASSSVDFNILKYRSKHTLSTDIEVEFFGFLLGGGYRRSSHLIAIDNVLNLIPNNISQYRESFNDGFDRIDVRLAYSYSNVKVTAIINNLLNEEYSERPGIFEPPRSLSLRADISL